MNIPIKTTITSLIIVCFFYLPQMTIGQTIHYQYDDLNRLTEISYGGNLIIQYGYDELGNRISYAVENTITSINEEIELAELKVFPNPASETLSIEAEFMSPIERLSLIFYNSSGQVIYTQQAEVANSKFSAQVDISGFATGAYLLEVTSGQKKWSKRLIVQR